MTQALLGAQAALLLAAVVVIVTQRASFRKSVEVALQHETTALDRARAAELRSAQQIDALLDRISTSPRVEVRPAESAPAVNPEEERYISDLPYADDAWNDFRGASDEEAAT